MSLVPILDRDDADLRVPMLLPRTLSRTISSGSTGKQVRMTVLSDSDEYLRAAPQSSGDSSHPVIAVNPDKSSFFHAMMSYRVATDAPFVTNMHNAMNLIASQREDLRMLDDFPWPKEFNRAESTGSSGVRVFLDKFCLRDGAQWEGSSQSSGGFVGAILKSLLFVPVFSVRETFHGSVGQMAQIWNPLWDACLSSRKDGRGFKVTSKTSSQFLEHDVITAVDGVQVSSIDSLWKSIAQKKESDSLCIEVEREISDKMFVEIQEMAAQGFGGGLHLNGSPFPDGLRSQDGLNSATSHESVASFAIAIDASNKLFFEELGLIQGDQVSLLSSKHGRVTAHNSAAFVMAVVEIANKDSQFANPSGKIRFKRSISRPDYQDNVLLELILARELHSKFSFESSVLQPCAAIFPIFRSEDVWKVSNFLSRKASTKTNEKVRSILQLNAIEPSVELKGNTLSPFEVFQYFAKFQGIKAWMHGEEDNQIQACSEKVLAIIQDRSKSLSSTFVKAHEGNTPQSIELRHWLQSVNMSYYARVLAHNSISSMHALSQLDENLKMMSKVAAEGAISSGRTHVAEYHQLLSAVKFAKKSELSKPLGDRFASFVDHDASFMTAAFSSRACDIMFAKPTVQVVFLIFGVSILAFLIYADMDNFKSGNPVKIASDLAAIVSACSLIGISLSYRFLEIKYARKSQYVVSFLLIACRIPSLYFASIDPCFNDIQCVIPQRIMSTIWIWSWAICLSIHQRYLVQAALLVGTLVCFAYAFTGEFAFYKETNDSFFGLYTLVLGLILFGCYCLAFIMKRHAVKTSSEIGNEHFSAINDVWSEITGKSKLAALCPNSRQKFKDSFKNLLDIPDEDQIDVDSLIRVWETSTTSVFVKQEYTDIKRLFEEAEFCNEAFQTWVSSWLAGGSSREDFCDKHLSKKYSVSMERLYYQSSDENPKFWKIISLGRLYSDDNRAKLLYRLHALFTSPPSHTELSAKMRQSFKAHFDEHSRLSIDDFSSRALIVCKISDRVAFETEELPSCALCFQNREEQVVLVLFAGAFKGICEYIQELQQGMEKSTDETVLLSLHIKFNSSADLHKISQFIVICDDPETDPELASSELLNDGRCDNSIRHDEARKVFDPVDANWTLISVNGRSDQIEPPSSHDTFRKTDVVYANAITKTFLNSRWFGCKFSVAFKTEDIDPSHPTYSWIDVKEKHLEPLRIPIPPLSGRHIRGPIKQASRTISKIFRSYNGHVNRVTDVVRCVVVLDTPSHVLKLIKKIIQNAWVEPCNPTLAYQLERLSLGLKPALVSRMKFEDRVVVAWRRLEYFFKCNILGFPRRTVKNSIQTAEEARLKGITPPMPKGAFELLRIRNRFSEENPEGGYRDVNIKLKIGFRDSESTRHPVFLPVEDWNLPGVKRMVVEMQLHLKALHDTTQNLESVHYNYIEARNLRSQ